MYGKISVVPKLTMILVFVMVKCVAIPVVSTNRCAQLSPNRGLSPQLLC